MHQNSKQTSPKAESPSKHSASAPLSPRGAEMPENVQGERIAKYLARCGVASRRESEKLVEKGRISVYFSKSRKKEKITHPSTLIAKTDQVFMDDAPLDPPAMPRLWRYHKPSGLITTHSDPLGRPTIFENLPQDLPRVISIGRLDLNSEGLLLLTNDGALSRELELPDRGWKRLYRVRVFGTVDVEALKKLKDGIVVEGVHYRSILAEPETDPKQGRNTWLRVQLMEGKNREIRRVMQALGLKVNRLIRLAYGPFSLDDLPVGKVEPLTPEEAHRHLPDYFPAVKSRIESPKNARNKSLADAKTPNRRTAQNSPKKETFVSAKNFSPDQRRKSAKRNVKK